MGPTALESLLTRHPWSERRMVEALMDRRALQDDLANSKISRLRTGSAQERWACVQEPVYNLLNLARADPARLYMLRKLGSASLWQGLSPAAGADAEGHIRGRGFQIFVDPGGIALEALDFLRDPPPHSSFHRIILAAGPDRQTLILRWVERSWKGGVITVDLAPNTSFWSESSHYVSYPRTIHPPAFRRSTLRSEKTRPPSIGKEQPVWDDLRHANMLGKAWVESGPSLLRKLTLAGNCPFLTHSEWMLLEGDVNRTGFREWKSLSATGLLLADLLSFEKRWILSSLGLSALLWMWKASPEDLRRYHPWPLSRSGPLRYSTGWMRKLGAHSTQVRQLTLSIAECGLRFSARKAFSVRSAVMLGSRLRYTPSESEGLSRTRFVSPDAYLSVGRGEGKSPASSYDFFLEVDRSTHPQTRLSDRLKKYAEIWRDLGRGSSIPILFWLTLDESRELFLLEEMRQLGIDGRTCTLNRVSLGAQDEWWLKHPLIGKELPYSSAGGMCPWRAVWRSTNAGELVYPVDVA